MNIVCNERGDRIMVLRPADPVAALAIAKDALASQDTNALARIVEELPHTFAGYLGEDRKSVVDDSGSVLGSLEAGDSFVAMLPPKVVA